MHVGTSSATLFAERGEPHPADQVPSIDEHGWDKFVAAIAEAANERRPISPEGVACTVVDDTYTGDGRPYIENRVPPSKVLDAAESNYPHLLEAGDEYRPTAVQMLTRGLEDYLDQFDLENYD